jgi:hypothetical protein
MAIHIIDAILAINPSAQVNVVGTEYDGISWLADTPEISKEVLDAKVAELEADYTNKQYQRDRAAAYPSLADQLDMLYHDAVDGTTTWQEAVAAVKAAHPKPEA